MARTKECKEKQGLLWPIVAKIDRQARKLIQYLILIYKVDLKTTEPIELSILWKLFIGPWVISGY